MALPHIFIVLLCVAFVSAVPATPTLTITGTTPAGDLSLGGTYTLSCMSSSSSVTYRYLKDGTVISSASLASVTAANTDGTYTCIASDSSNANSQPSPGLTVKVNAAGRYCANNAGCTDDTAYTGVCTNNRCVCESTHTAVALVCIAKPAKPTLTIPNAVVNDLSAGHNYNLVCASTTTGVTFIYFKDGTALGNAALTAVTSTTTAGRYTCRAVLNGAHSDLSDVLTVAVGASGLRCTANTGCTGIPYSGTCTSNRCVCATNYVASANACFLPGRPCSANSECVQGVAYTGVCTATRCVCTATYVPAGNVCRVKPVKPTLTIGTATANDLSAGATYTLTCRTTTTGTITYTYFRGTMALTSGTLSSVSTSATAGSYTCRATLNEAPSDASDALTLRVGASGLRCTANTGCAGTAYSGTCTSNRCVCATGHWASGAACILVGRACTTTTAATACSGTGYTGTCTNTRCVCASGYKVMAGACTSSAVTVTVSLFGLLLAFATSKLF